MPNFHPTFSFPFFTLHCDSYLMHHVFMLSETVNAGILIVVWMGECEAFAKSALGYPWRGWKALYKCSLIYHLYIIPTDSSCHRVSVNFFQGVLIIIVEFGNIKLDTTCNEVILFFFFFFIGLFLHFSDEVLNNARIIFEYFNLTLTHW